MREWQSQTHVKWYCRYHVVIVPKYRRKSIVSKKGTKKNRANPTRLLRGSIGRPKPPYRGFPHTTRYAGST